ncbi:elongation of very long chain fatty acids protein-like [Diabrotica virgifera virgifera]|uniref:Elongation of very long chain fatty acids protein n=1 Tax=Diabrotica virgifera virgifera TaxID=50390 RepID=A0ABM5JKD5_DIAVI|nr:elongation of very long chain fatty acids protein-like [Diabrotica virgifera virgifera]
MEYLTRNYGELMEKHSDTRVKDWLFMDSPIPTIYIILAYIVTVLYILPKFMQNRKPFELTTIIRAYNLSQVAACCYLIYTIATSGWIQGDYSLGCQTVDYSNTPNAVRVAKAFYLVYWLKCYEMIETGLFGLRKKFKQISVLHVYHHSSSLVLAFLATKFIPGGMFALPVMMNLLIHVFMYTYYYLSSLGPEWQASIASWKPWMTISQMIQFTLMIIHSSTAFMPGCDVPKLFFYLYMPNVFLLFKMFFDFYQKSYKKRGDKKFT